MLSSCVFDNAAFGRVTFESSIMCYPRVVVLSLSRCIVLVKVSRDTEVFEMVVVPPLKDMKDTDLIGGGAPTTTQTQR